VSSRILPPAEGETTPISLRFPSLLLKRVDAIAKVSGHDRTAVIVNFVRWACAEYEAEQRELANAQGTKPTT
jgi:metal-responsive CopG/Arc/MetJ family transcriptional regulator